MTARFFFVITCLLSSTVKALEYRIEVEEPSLFNVEEAIANTIHGAAERLTGMPEAQITLAHAAVYLATAPKSNTAYLGLLNAQNDVSIGRTLTVPMHLRTGHYKQAKKLGHGEGYLYSHNYEGNYVPQAYLPEGKRYYEPTQNGQEIRIAERLEFWRKTFENAQKKGEN